jgi:TPR-GreAB-C-PIN type conflict system protein
LADAPAEVYAWLGLLCTDYGAWAAAQIMLTRAIDAGVYPRGYYMARRAQSAGISDQAITRRMLEQAPDDHPFHLVLRHALAGEYGAAIAALSGWVPESEEQRIIRGVQLAAAQDASGSRSQAIATARQVWDEFRAAGAGLLAARLLLARAAGGNSLNRATDAQDALNLALAARNERRAWRGDSSEAVEVAATAAMLARDPQRAWTITEAGHDGEAQNDEAQDPRVRVHAAIIAALTGRTESARALLPSVEDPFIRAQVEALIAERSEDPTAAVACWWSAWHAAQSDPQRLEAARALAVHGEDLPDLTSIDPQYQDAIPEIKLVAEVLHSTDPMAALRANQHRSRMLVSELAGRYDESEEYRNSADTLLGGAEKWDDPELMALAAFEYRKADAPDTARSSARRAITMGGPTWPGRLEMLALMVRLDADAKDWAGASAGLRQLVAYDPNDLDNHWNLVRCLVNAGELRDGWNALTSPGAPIEPRDAEEALLWLQLHARYGTDPTFLAGALIWMRRWPDDPDTLGSFIRVAYAGIRDKQPSDDDLAELHAVTADYFERFPDSSTFQAITLGPEDDPLLPMSEMLRQQYEATAPVHAEVQAGRFPLAILSEVHGRSFAEASLMRAAGRVYAEVFPTQQSEIEAAIAAHGTPVVIDPTAAHSLVLLDSDLRALMLGSTPTVNTTNHLYRDAIRGRESLALRSNLSVGWDPATGRPMPREIPQQTTDDLAERAQDLVDLLGAVSRRPHPELLHLPDISGHATAWLSGIDLAKEHGWIYWSDDRVMRRLAEQEGVASFGSVALLGQLHVDGSITAERLEVARSTLIRNFYVDLGFRREEMELAAAAAGWAPAGAALALSSPTCWTNPEETFEFVLSAIDHVAIGSPHHVAGWSQAASRALIDMTDQDQASAQNLAIVLRRAVVHPRINGVVLFYFLQGVRMAIKQSDARVIEDPLGGTLREVHRAAVQERGHPAAAQILLHLTAAQTEADQSLAARTILTANY